MELTSEAEIDLLPPVIDRIKSITEESQPSDVEYQSSEELLPCRSRLFSRLDDEVDFRCFSFFNNRDAFEWSAFNKLYVAISLAVPSKEIFNRDTYLN